MPTLDTPCLCLDLDAFDANIAEMAALCRANQVGWRPHSKCFKSVAIAKRLIAPGAIGLTCAKLGEAEVFAAAGIRDLLIANLIVGETKVRRLVALRQIANPLVCIDHLDQARPLSAAMHVAGLRLRCLVEIDIGMNRAGVTPGDKTLELAQQIAELPGLELAGAMGYEGHLLLLADPVEKAARVHAALDLLVAARDQLLSAGLPCPIVSCGGTGSLPHCVEHPGVTEVQAGGVIFMDQFYREKCHIAQFQNSLTVLTTVVSRPAPDRAIIDAGRKTMNMELALPVLQINSGGRCPPAIRVKNLSAEHGILELDPAARDLRIGERLRLIPGYVDFTTVLHNQFHVFRGEELVDIWPLEARGRLT